MCMARCGAAGWPVNGSAGAARGVDRGMIQFQNGRIGRNHVSQMSFDNSLLDIVCCPLTRAPLERLSEAKLHQLNTLIRQNRIKNEAKEIVEEPLTDALVTRDGRIAYPVRDGIPVLLIDQGITLSQLD